MAKLQFVKYIKVEVKLEEAKEVDMWNVDIRSK